jgi:hypothetical protein
MERGACGNSCSTSTASAPCASSAPAPIRARSAAISASAGATSTASSPYGAVPDHLLAGIERLLNEREKLRRLVSTLMHRSEFLP